MYMTLTKCAYPFEMYSVKIHKTHLEDKVDKTLMLKIVKCFRHFPYLADTWYSRTIYI